MTSLKISQEEGLLSPLIDNSYAYNQTKKVHQMVTKREEFSKNHYHTPQIALTKMETNRAKSQGLWYSGAHVVLFAPLVITLFYNLYFLFVLAIAATFSIGFIVMDEHELIVHLIKGLSRPTARTYCHIIFEVFTRWSIFCLDS